MDSNANENKLAGVVDRLKNVRNGYEDCMSDVSPEAANKGPEWSIADLLRHVNGDTFYETMTNRILNEQSPHFEGYDPGERLRQVIERTLTGIDDALKVATHITGEQLTRTGTRGDRTYTAVDTLESWTAHFEDHLFQLRNEIRPREGLSSPQ